jgi:hypothetical protein
VLRTEIDILNTRLSFHNHHCATRYRPVYWQSEAAFIDDVRGRLLDEVRKGPGKRVAINVSTRIQRDQREVRTKDFQVHHLGKCLI